MQPPAEWSTPREALALACARPTASRCLRIALVVGTILTAINEGGAIVAGDLHGLDWLKVVGNYLVPFFVSMTGFLSAKRAPKNRTSRAR